MQEITHSPYFLHIFFILCPNTELLLRLRQICGKETNQASYKNSPLATAAASVFLYNFHKIKSTVPYNCWNRLPKNSGNANRINPFAILPSVKFVFFITSFRHRDGRLPDVPALLRSSEVFPFTDIHTLFRIFPERTSFRQIQRTWRFTFNTFNWF